jgi:hypothetical protein
MTHNEPMSEDLVMQRPPSMALPSAAQGALCFFFLADLSRAFATGAYVMCLPLELTRGPQPTFGERLGIAVVGAAIFAVAGHWISTSLHNGRRAWIAALTGCLAASQIAATVATALGSSFGQPLVTGALAAAMCLPGTWLMTNTLVTIAAMRPGSLLARALRRGPWLVVALFGVIVAGLFAHPVFGLGRSPEAELTRVAAGVVSVAGVVAAFLALALAASLATLDRLRRRCRRVEGPDDAGGARVLDIGTGDDVRCDVVGHGSAYRRHAETRAVLRGDVVLARAFLRSALAVALAAMALATLVLFTRIEPPEIDVTSPWCEHASRPQAR